MPSFTIDPARAVPNEQPDAPRAVGAGVQGGSQGVRLQAPQRGAVGGVDMKLLMQFGGNLLEPIIKREQEAKFLDGMSRASQGEAAADIAAKRPEWAQAFGDDAATQGARAFEKVSDSAAFQTEVMENMTVDRSLPPEEFTASIYKRLQARKSGDPLRDQVLMQSVIGWLPDAQRMHTRAHKAWGQEQAEASHAQAADHVVQAAVSTVEAVRNDPRLKDEQAYENSKAALVSLFQPLPGVDYEKQTLRVVDALRASMHRGEFGALQMLREADLLGKIPAQHQDQLLATERQQAARYLPERAAARVPQVVDAWAVLLANRDMTPEQVRAAASGINKNVAMATGIDAVPFITADQIERKIISDIADDERRREAEEAKRQRDRERAQDRALALADKAREKREELAAIQAQVQAAFATTRGTGATGAMIEDLNSAIPGTKKVADEYLRTLWNQGPQDPQALAQHRANLLKDYVGTNGPIPQLLQARLHSSLNAAEVTPDVLQDLMTVHALRGTPAAGRLFTGDMYSLAEAVLNASARDPNADPKTVLQVARAQVRTEKLGKQSLPKAAAKELEDLWEDSEVGNATPLLARALDDISGISGSDERQLHFTGAATRLGVRKSGGVTFTQLDPETPDWNSKLLAGGRLNDDEAGEFFRAAVDDAVKSMKADPRNVQVLRQPDDPVRGPVFLILHENGHRLISGEDILSRRKSSLTKAPMRTRGNSRAVTPYVAGTDPAR